MTTELIFDYGRELISIWKLYHTEVKTVIPRAYSDKFVAILDYKFDSKKETFEELTEEQQGWLDTRISKKEITGRSL